MFMGSLLWFCDNQTDPAELDLDGNQTERWNFFKCLPPPPFSTFLSCLSGNSWMAVDERDMEPHEENYQNFGVRVRIVLKTPITRNSIFFMYKKEYTGLQGFMWYRKMERLFPLTNSVTAFPLCKKLFSMTRFSSFVKALSIILTFFSSMFAVTLSEVWIIHEVSERGSQFWKVLNLCSWETRSCRELSDRKFLFPASQRWSWKAAVHVLYIKIFSELLCFEDFCVHYALYINSALEPTLLPICAFDNLCFLFTKIWRRGMTSGWSCGKRRGGVKHAPHVGWRSVTKVLKMSRSEEKTDVDSAFRGWIVRGN